MVVYSGSAGRKTGVSGSRGCLLISCLKNVIILKSIFSKYVQQRRVISGKTSLKAGTVKQWARLPYRLYRIGHRN